MTRKTPSLYAPWHLVIADPPSWQIGYLRLVVVSAAADGVTGHPEHCQNDADHQHNNADRPDDGDLRDEPDNEQDNAENDQLWLLAVIKTRQPPPHDPLSVLLGRKGAINLAAAARVQSNTSKLPPRDPSGLG
jgi:hypothetical protein